jgi:hypothetical protein
MMTIEIAHIEMHELDTAGIRAEELISRAWNSHPDRLEHEALLAEVDSRGRPLWHTWMEPDPDDPDAVLLVFGPIDPLGGRARRIGRWPRSAIAEP